MSGRLKQWFALLVFGIASIALYIVSVRGQPRETFSPLCSSSFTYRLNVTIEFSGKQYSSEVIGELMRNRAGMGGSCAQPVGSIISFRLEDNRLVLIYGTICPHAARVFAGGHNGAAYERGYEGNLADKAFLAAMKEHQKVDLAPLCIGVSRNRPEDYVPPTMVKGHTDGFVIDNADNPTRWRGFTFDRNSNFDSVIAAEQLHIVSAVAEAANLSADDGLEKIAPAILKTDFEGGDWSMSPAAMFYSRAPPYKKDHIYKATKESLQAPSFGGR
jgi:hypothetical protein